MKRFLSLVLSAFALASASAAEKPNIVMIIGDDQGFADYGFMGHPQIKTPNLDKLAEQSLRFDRGYVPTSLCRASLASMVTGLYPHQHKITSNDPPLPAGLNTGQAMKNEGFLKMRQEMAAYMEKADNLPKLLAKAGYVSHQSGKWWEGGGCRCGFDEAMTHGDPAKGGRHGDEGLKIGRQGLKPVFDFIDKSKGDKKPFYLWYAPMMPHTPHNPPERLLAKYKDKTDSLFIAKYWAMCEWFDETVGDLLKKLDDAGVSDNTIVVYLHDNGWIQDAKKDGYAPRSKRSPYEGGLRTPILIRWPKVVKPTKIETAVSSIDIAPTLLKAVGAAGGDKLPGANLLDAEAVKKRDVVFGAIFEHNAIDIHKPEANLQYRWVVEGDWKLIVPKVKPDEKGIAELYNLKNDPGETRNLNATKLDEATTAAKTRLEKRLNEWWKP